MSEPMVEPGGGDHKAPGTTSWDGSITALGTEMRSYYGRPVVKEPTWTWEVPLYLFTGGIAGGASVLHGFAKMAGHERLARRSLLVAGAMNTINPVLLVSDLGRPERFLNMLRVFKITSPMSVGSWILFTSSGATVTGAALEVAGIFKPVRALAEAVSFLTGAPLATYTGALLANTSIPVWSEARQELPYLFGSSGLASAGAAVGMFLPTAEARPARRLAIGSAAIELGVMEVMKHRLGMVGEPYEQGDAGRYNKIAKTCVGAGAGLLALAGRRSRAASVAGGGLLLAGELALRWSAYRAGFQSARDPKYTVVPQRARRDAQRARGQRPGTEVPST
jgi:hypothetical protein